MIRAIRTTAGVLDGTYLDPCVQKLHGLGTRARIPPHSSPRSTPARPLTLLFKETFGKCRAACRRVHGSPSSSSPLPSSSFFPPLHVPVSFFSFSPTRRSTPLLTTFSLFSLSLFLSLSLSLSLPPSPSPSLPLCHTRARGLPTWRWRRGGGKGGKRGKRRGLFEVEIKKIKI